MKRHRQDLSHAILIAQNEETQESQTFAGVAYRVHTVSADIIYMDHGSGESKESRFSVFFVHYDDRGVLEIQENTIATDSKYDGERAWAASGVTRAQMDLHEEFYHRGTFGTRPGTTVGEIRKILWDRVTARREEALNLDAGTPSL